MTAEELERLAASDSDMPDDLSMPDELLFLTLRTLYQNFHNGIVNRERAKREKSRIMVAYGKLQSEYKIMQHNMEIRKRLQKNMSDLYDCGCPNCRKLLNIFVGVDRRDIPEDIKQVNALNERLRDKVKELGDRNAVLATTIDRVRWALEKGDYERVKEIVN